MKAWTFPSRCRTAACFLMGDNRNNSTDSRDTRVGCVDERDIMGAAVLRVLPFGKIGAARMSQSDIISSRQISGSPGT